MRSFSPLFLLLPSLFVTSLTACGGRTTGADDSADETSSDEESESESETAGVETGDGDGDGDSAGDGDGDIPSGECEVEVVETENCGDPCPVTVDLKVRCDSDEFGDPGLRVAPMANDPGVYLTTSGSDHAWLMALQADGSGPIDFLPEGFERETSSFAQSTDGIVAFAADLTKFAGTGMYPGGASYYEPAPGTGEVAVVFDNPDKYTSVLDVEFDSQGVPHMWLLSDAPHEWMHGTRPGGEWQTQIVPVPGDSGWGRFGLDSADQAVAYDFVETGGSWRLFASDGQDTYQVGSGFGSSYPGAYASPIAQPRPALAAPDYSVAAFSQHGASFKVSAASASGWDEVPVSTEPPLNFGCLDGYDGLPGNCPVECEEVVSGLWEGSVAAARTSDGRWWAAWVVTHNDQTLSFEESCSDEVGCWCNATVERDDSWGEVVLAELDFTAGTTHEVLRIPSLDPELHGAFGDYREQPRTFDMRAHGEQLAIGLRVRSVEGGWNDPDMRVMRLDTSVIPGL